MVITRGWLTLGRVLLASSAVILLAAVPPLLAGSAAPVRIVVVIGLTAFAVLWIWFWWYGVSSSLPGVGPGGVLMLVVVLGLLTYLAQPGRDGLLFAALAAGAALSVRRAAVAVGAIAMLAAAVQLAHGAAPLTAVGSAVNDFVVGVAAMGGRLLLLTNRELAHARDEIAALAVNQERLRLARDLHDLLGQDLTLAVLKSELAARDLPADTPDVVRELLAETSAAVRKSLDDVRSAAAGFRRLGLRSELASARSGLTAAGIEFLVDDRLGDLPGDREEALAWALREAVTNVLRHSRASRCSVVLRRDGSSAVMEVEDDGVGSAPGTTGGGGLTGIGERLAPLDGSVRASPRDGAGYRLSVSVPIPRPRP